MTERPRVVVVGSVHMDLIATADRLPDHGESVSGGVFTMAPGGKAGNQACQFALAGASVQILTRLGDDIFGRHFCIGFMRPLRAEEAACEGRYAHAGKARLRKAA